MRNVIVAKLGTTVFQFYSVKCTCYRILMLIEMLLLSSMNLKRTFLFNEYPHGSETNWILFILFCNKNQVFGLDVAALHSDKRQAERTSVLHSFREGLLPVLVSTAVLGRGLDLPKVKLVINFDMSASVEEYIHQVSQFTLTNRNSVTVAFCL